MPLVTPPSKRSSGDADLRNMIGFQPSSSGEKKSSSSKDKKCDNSKEKSSSSSDNSEVVAVVSSSPQTPSAVSSQRRNSADSVSDKSQPKRRNSSESQSSQTRRLSNQSLHKQFQDQLKEEKRKTQGENWTDFHARHGGHDRAVRSSSVHSLEGGDKVFPFAPNKTKTSTKGGLFGALTGSTKPKGNIKISQIDQYALNRSR